MEIGSEILEGIPLLVELEVAQAFGARERWVDDAHASLLRRAMNDELAAQHGNIGVDLIRLLIDECSFTPTAMEGVAGAVAADEPLAVGDGLEQGALAFDGHGRLLVPALPGEVACRLKDEAIVLGD